MGQTPSVGRMSPESKTSTQLFPRTEGRPVEQATAAADPDPEEPDCRVSGKRAEKKEMTPDLPP